LISGEFKKKISVTLSPFVPKADTPFQWESFAPPETLKEKAKTVTKALASRRNISVKSQSPREAGMEAIFSRGDANVGDALLHWYGSRSWKRAFRSAGVLPEEVVFRKLTRKDRLPWDFIDTSFPKSLLSAELNRARKAAL
jgi:hypothetical protein